MATTKLRTTYNAARVLEDMAARGWDVKKLAHATDLSHMTIRRFLDGHIQTTKTAAKIATALGYSPRRYFAGVVRVAA